MRLRLAFADEVGEDGVHPVDDRPQRPEVLGEIDRAVGEPVMNPSVEGDVRPPEAVDGLLRIADEEEPALLHLRLLPAG